MYIIHTFIPPIQVNPILKELQTHDCVSKRQTHDSRDNNGVKVYDKVKNHSYDWIIINWATHGSLLFLPFSLPGSGWSELLEQKASCMWLMAEGSDHYHLSALHGRHSGLDSNTLLYSCQTAIWSPEPHGCPNDTLKEKMPACFWLTYTRRCLAFTKVATREEGKINLGRTGHQHCQH